MAADGKRTSHTMRLEQAKVQGYLVMQGSQRAQSASLRHTFFDWCEQEGVPYAIVWLRPKSADLELDFIAYPHECQPDEACRDAAEACVREYPVAHDWSRGIFGRISLGSAYWNVSRFPVDQAEELMGRLVALAPQVPVPLRGSRNLPRRRR